MNSKRTWPYATIATGILVTVTGWILTHTTLLLAWQLGDANSEASACASSLGILAQASDPTARAHCQLASTAQTVSAVMIWLGILVIAAGAIWLYRRMRSVPKAPEMYAAPTPLDRAMQRSARATMMILISLRVWHWTSSARCGSVRHQPTRSPASWQPPVSRGE